LIAGGNRNRKLMKPLNLFFCLAGISTVFLQLAEASESVCYGTVSNGKLLNGVQLPASGKNFSSYSTLGNTLGRTFLHSTVQKIVVRAYSQLETATPQKTFIYGETGFSDGGKFKPHRTHQNGLSVDFMVPVMRSNGQSTSLPTSAMNKFGYGIEFDKQAKFGELSIDFEAMAEHLYQLDIAAKQEGSSIALVIFEPLFHAKLFATSRGSYLKHNVRFMERQAWIRHDEHFHVDFKVACENMPPTQ
jgi:penicillin-insensitive murein DD-endopeptidase